MPAYPGMTVERDARAVNEGSAVMAARMRFEKSWGSLEDGAWTACDDGSLDESLIEVELPEGSGWVDGGDGWYYYERPVNPGESTDAFISTCSISEHVGEDAHVGEASAYSGKAARVDVYLECAQAFQESADGPAESASSGGGQVVHRLPRSVTAAFAPQDGRRRACGLRPVRRRMRADGGFGHPACLGPAPRKRRRLPKDGALMNANPRTRAAAVCATALLLAATLFCAALAKGGVSRAWGRGRRCFSGDEPGVPHRGRRRVRFARPGRRSGGIRQHHRDHRQQHRGAGHRCRRQGAHAAKRRRRGARHDVFRSGLFDHVRELHVGRMRPRRRKRFRHHAHFCPHHRERRLIHHGRRHSAQRD